MIVIGITGPTGAGKGFVGTYLQQQGALFIDTDRIARETVEAGSPTLKELVTAFGEDILRQDGTLDRRTLAAKAFADKERTALLGRITHPPILRRCEELIASSDAPMAVLDAPLLFESGADRLCDTTLAVLAPREHRLRRILARDGLTREQAELRMNAQPTDAFYRERAAHTLINDGDADTLYRAVEAWLTDIKEGTV